METGRNGCSAVGQRQLSSGVVLRHHQYVSLWYAYTLVVNVDREKAGDDDEQLEHAGTWAQV